jgi:hypothetical protein
VHTAQVSPDLEADILVQVAVVNHRAVLESHDGAKVSEVQADDATVAAARRSAVRPTNAPMTTDEGGGNDERRRWQ